MAAEYGKALAGYRNNGSIVNISAGATENTITAFKNADSDIVGSSYSDSYSNYMKRAFDPNCFKINGQPIDICKRGYRPRTMYASTLNLGAGSFTLTCDSSGSKACNGITLSPSNSDANFKDAFFIWGSGAGGSGGTGNSSKNGAGGGAGCSFAGVLTFNGTTNTKVTFSIGSGGASETGDGDNYGHAGGSTTLKVYNSSGTQTGGTVFGGGSGGGANGGGGGSGGTTYDEALGSITRVISDSPYMAYITVVSGANGGNSGAWGGNVSWNPFSQRPEGSISNSYSGGKPGGSDNNRGGGGGASGWADGSNGTTYKNDSSSGSFGSGSGGTGFRVIGSIGNSGTGGNGFINMIY